MFLLVLFISPPPVELHSIISINADLIFLTPELGILVDLSTHEVIDDDSTISVFQKHPGLRYD